MVCPAEFCKSGKCLTGNVTVLIDGLGAAPPQGLEQFRDEHGRYPDLVVLHSNYWDIAQIVLYRWWEAWEPEYVALMRDWLERADKVARFLEVRCCPSRILCVPRCQAAILPVLRLSFIARRVM